MRNKIFYSKDMLDDAEFLFDEISAMIKGEVRKRIKTKPFEEREGMDQSKYYS